MFRLILLTAAAVPVALAFSSQQQDAAPARTLAEAARAQEETPASIWWADYDADGLEDALAVSAAGEPQLLQNLGDGQFTNATRSAGLAGVTGARFAAWADVDGDGATDLYIGTTSGPKLFVNQTGGVFVEAAARSGLGHTAADLDAHFLDYDRDGRVDLHVQTAGGDQLYRGLGAGQFERVELGLPAAPAPSGAVVAHGHEDAPAAPAPRARDERAPGASRAAGAPGARGARGGAAPSNPLATRQPVPVPPGSYASVPCAFVNASASSVFDQTTNQCLLASSQGTIGNLYPLSNDFNVDAAGSVGIGTTNPMQRLHVHNGNVRVSGAIGPDIELYDGSADPGILLKTNANGTDNRIELYRNGNLSVTTPPSGQGHVTQWLDSVTSNVLAVTGAAPDGSGFMDTRNNTGVTMVDLDADAGAGASTDGRIRVRSSGTGGPGGQLTVSTNDNKDFFKVTGGASGDGPILEMFDVGGERSLLIDGSSSGQGAVLQMFNDSGFDTVTIDGDYSGDGGYMEVGNGLSNSPTVWIEGKDLQNDGAITIRAGDLSNSLFLEGDAENGGGAFSVRNDKGSESFRVWGDDGDDSSALELYDRMGGNNFDSFRVVARDTFNTGARVLMTTDGTTNTVELDGEDGNGGEIATWQTDGSRAMRVVNNALTLYDGAGTATITFNGLTGGKSGVSTTKSYGQRLLYAVESPENWFEDFGSAALRNGVARIDLDPVFLETVTIDEQHPMKVFLTLGDDCNGLFVEKGADHFVVRELGGGKSNAKFDWRLVAKRTGLEDTRLAVFDESLGGELDPVVPHVPHVANDSTGRADLERR